MAWHGSRGLPQEARLQQDAGTERRRAAQEKEKGDELFFCVQKHLASHLHYDFRLEWNGVLLSWAVPKGPSIDPKDKRLAMQTEDHPFDYGMFEGVIPEGYGAGIVMLWDYGTWEPESEDVDAALRKGDLKFRLNGFKLKGSWVLVKTHGYGGAPNSWLLIKHRTTGPARSTSPSSRRSASRRRTPTSPRSSPARRRTSGMSNAPAKGGDTGAMFKKIIERAHVDEGAGHKQQTTTKTAKTRKPRLKSQRQSRKRRSQEVASCVVSLRDLREPSRQVSSRCDSTDHTAYDRRWRSWRAISGAPEIADHRFGAAIAGCRSAADACVRPRSAPPPPATAAPGWRSPRRPCGRSSC